MRNVPNFVNRTEELRIVEELFDNPMRPVQTQFIEFYGVGGIGKTTILKKAEDICNDWHTDSIWADASQSAADFFPAVVNQVHRNGILITSGSIDVLDQSISAIRALLEGGPVVFLVDSLDAASEELLNGIGYMLRTFAEDTRLFFVFLASKRRILFEHEKYVSSRLTPVQLKPFDRTSCISYVNELAEDIEPTVQDIVFEWTGGYPLAVNIMVQAIHNEKLDPRKEEDRMQILSKITEQVINRGILSDAAQVPDGLQWYQTMLSLFSVPRRCNISMMQRMIETFAPQYRLSGDLAYLAFPKKINREADVLYWNPSKAGYSMDASIRHVFLNKLKIEQPEKYAEIHKFLADINKREASKYAGTDRIRALHEYLYHSACCEEATALQQIVEKTVQQFISESATDASRYVENFSFFHEEYMRDEELQAVLGANSDTVVSLMYRNFAAINRQLTVAASNQERVDYLREFFNYSILDPAVPNVRLLAQQLIQEIVGEESVDICHRLYDLLSSDVQITERLDVHAHDILSLLISFQNDASS